MNEKVLSIRRVSDITGVPPHTLRFWEKVMPHVLCPSRTAGGQRRYDPDSVERVLAIKRLVTEGRSLAAIREQFSVSLIDCSENDFEKFGRAELINLIVGEVTLLLREKLERLFEVQKLTQT